MNPQHKNPDSPSKFAVILVFSLASVLLFKVEIWPWLHTEKPATQSLTGHSTNSASGFAIVNPSRFLTNAPTVPGATSYDVPTVRIPSTPTLMTFTNPAGQNRIDVYMNGKVDLHGMKADDASRLFWQALETSRLAEPPQGYGRHWTLFSKDRHEKIESARDFETRNDAVTEYQDLLTNCPSRFMIEEVKP